jgi:hypothetical protein
VTVSLVAIFVGGLLSVGRGRGRLPTTTVTVVVAALLGLLRPVLIPLIIVAVLLACVAGWERHGRTSRAFVPALVLAMVGLCATSYAWNYNVQLDRTWGEWMSVPGLKGRTLTQYYLAAYTTPSGPEIIDAMVSAGAPACIRQEPTPAPDDAPIDRVQVDRLACPHGQAWLSEHYISTLARHLARHPTAGASYFSDALGDASVVSVQNAVDEESLPSLVPGPVERLFFTPREGSGLGPLLMWSTIAGVAVGVRASVRRRLVSVPAGFAAPRALRWPLAVALLAGYAALVGTALLSASDASRVALPVTVLIRLMLVAVTALAIGTAVREAPFREPAQRPPLRWPPAAGAGGSRR